jgi:two-component system, sensor histidine kinase RegB
MFRKGRDGRVLVDSVDSRLRIYTIVRLRWIAVLGQLVTILFVSFGLGFSLPVGVCLIVIAISAWLNVFLAVWYPSRHRLSVWFATALLAYDIAQLAMLLYLTGGIDNPFTMLMAAPVTVSAATLPLRNTVALGLMALSATGILVVFHEPLPWYRGLSFELPLIYKFGAFAAVCASTTFLALYAWRLTKESRQMSAALTATDLVLAREQKLHALDGLAAAAAHELGTPLSTIVLISKELERVLQDNSPLTADIKTLREQAQRCRDILAKITQLSSSGAPFDRMKLSTLIEEVVAPHRDFGVAIKVRIAVAGASEPVGTRNPAILYGVGNILENAVDFAHNAVEVNAWWNNDTVEIIISDDGPGFAPDILKRIGEPYLSRRRGGDDAQSEHRGLGLGVFIARTLLERTGAKVSFSNRVFPDHGAVVQIAWARQRFEAGEANENPV